MTLILSNDDVEKLLTMPECIDVLEEAYVELAEGRGVNRTRSDCITPTSNPDAVYGLKSMDGVIPKLGIGAIRINSDIVTFPKKGNNVVREKVPAANGRYVGLVLLFSSENGEPLAIMPDGVMQRMRVGAANGLGIKYLARKNASTVGILGCGWQAGAQLMAACAVRKITSIRCFSPTKDQPRSLRQADERAARRRGHRRSTSRRRRIAGADIAMCASNSLDTDLLRALGRAGHAHELDQAAGDRGEGGQARRPARAACARGRARSMSPRAISRSPRRPTSTAGRRRKDSTSTSCRPCPS